MAFQLTRLMRGVTQIRAHSQRPQKISTHTPHARRDWYILTYVNDQNQFQLTRLMRGVTYRSVTTNPTAKFQLTRLMRGVTAKTMVLPQPVGFQLTRLMRGVTPHCRPA